MERSISFVQTYILEYVTGILWILGLIVALPGTSNVAGIVSTTASALKPLKEFEIPDAVIGGLAAVAGVVIPYAIAMAFRPLSLWPMNGLLKAFRLFEKKILKRERRDLHRLTVKCLEAALAITSTVDYPEQLAFITSKNEAVAAALEWARNDAVFRAASVLPSALLFGAIAFRFTPASLTLAVAIGVVAFLLGATFAIQMLGRWRDRTESLILLYASSEERLTNAPDAHSPPRFVTTVQIHAGGATGGTAGSSLTTVTSLDSPVEPAG
ncbi:MAG: hypothetical protein JO231_21375 [Acidobacteria bacterium]|nr:hypothetical protein [Acidobacteriota bacterium]